MRILRVISSMDPSHGGPCQGIRNTIPAMESLGLRNDVLCLDEPDAPFLKQEAFTVYAIGKSKGPWAYSSRLLPWLEKNMGNYDIVIVHGLWLYHSYAVYKAFRRAEQQPGDRRPGVFVMPHGMLDPYFQRAAGRRFKSIRNWLYWKFIEHKVVNAVDGLLFTCEEELRLARVPFSPYKPNRELNVGYGIVQPRPYTIDLEKVMYKKYPQLNGQPYILFLSRIHEKKGVDLLIKAYLQIKKQYESIPQLVIAGPGLDTAFGQQVKATAGEDEDIVFTGMLTGDMKWAAFYGSEAFVLPSHQENFGIAVVEAMACGKAVLLSKQVNIWREIEQEGAGLVEQDDVDGIKKMLINWIIKSEKEKDLMRMNAFETYRKYFTVEQAAKRMSDALINYAGQ